MDLLTTNFYPKTQLTILSNFFSPNHIFSLTILKPIILLKKFKLTFICINCMLVIFYFLARCLYFIIIHYSQKKN